MTQNIDTLHYIQYGGIRISDKASTYAKTSCSSLTYFFDVVHYYLNNVYGVCVFCVCYSFRGKQTSVPCYIMLKCLPFTEYLVDCRKGCGRQKIFQMTLDRRDTKQNASGNVRNSSHSTSHDHDTSWSGHPSQKARFKVEHERINSLASFTSFSFLFHYY